MFRYGLRINPRIPLMPTGSAVRSSAIAVTESQLLTVASALSHFSKADKVIGSAQHEFILPPRVRKPRLPRLARIALARRSTHPWPVLCHDHGDDDQDRPRQIDGTESITAQQVPEQSTEYRLKNQNQRDSAR